MDPSSRHDVLAELPSLRRYALSLTRHAEDAEDLVHETLVRAYDGRAGFRPERNLRRWLMSILHNAFIDGLRANRARNARHEAVFELMEPVMPASQEHVVRLAQVQRAFLHLPDEQREIMHLVAIEGLTYAQAAEVLDVPVGTVMSRIGRARERLRHFEDGDPKIVPLRRIGGHNDKD